MVDRSRMDLVSLAGTRNDPDHSVGTCRHRPLRPACRIVAYHSDRPAVHYANPHSAVSARISGERRALLLHVDQHAPGAYRWSAAAQRVALRPSCASVRQHDVRNRESAPIPPAIRGLDCRSSAHPARSHRPIADSVPAVIRAGSGVAFPQAKRVWHSLFKERVASSRRSSPCSGRYTRPDEELSDREHNAPIMQHE